MSHLDLFAFANQGKYASQNDDATHCFCHRFIASQTRSVIQPKSASHVFIEAQENHASQKCFATHRLSASQRGCATQIDPASQGILATHSLIASQVGHATRR